MSTQPAEFELSISRVIDAPRSRVFRAWTEPSLLQQWWGPHGMTTPECEMNLWVGGLFRTLMRAPDGAEYPTQGVFLEIVAPRRLVFTDAFAPGWIPRHAHKCFPSFFSPPKATHKAPEQFLRWFRHSAPD